MVKIDLVSQTASGFKRHAQTLYETLENPYVKTSENPYLKNIRKSLFKNIRKSLYVSK
jgi:hypothetical protein